MNFWEAVTSSIRHIHPLLTDFPAAFLPVSVLLLFLSRRWPNLRQPAWITMLVGTAGAVLAFMTGDAIAETLPAQVQAFVQPHQILASLTTLFFVGLTIWQWQSQRRHKDVMQTTPFMVLSVIGMLLLIVTGMFGGSLVFDHAIGVAALP